MKKKINIACAIIFNAGKILIAQREPGGNYGGYWEFPGGKREDGESLEDCLEREALEELNIHITPIRFFAVGDHPLPDKTLTLYFYLCRYERGEPQCFECHQCKWVFPHELPQYRFPPADEVVINALIAQPDLIQ